MNMLIPSHNLGRQNFGDPANINNLLSREEALSILNDWVPNDRLRLHMKQVAANMAAWAQKMENLDELNIRKWELAGLLHDADWEMDPANHCRVIIEELEKRQVDPEVIRCIACHSPRYFGVEPESKMEKMIYVFDELSGLIHAVALMRPTRYEGMEVKSVLKKIKTPSFAAQVSREDIYDAISRIDFSLEEIVEFIIRTQASVE